jgi:hypothetical protein
VTTRPYAFPPKYVARTRASARTIVPMILELFAPSSVCDVGCGRGTWLKVFEEHGIADIRGIDGERIPEDELEIQPDQVVVADLEQGVPADRRFDLAVCLEVAEHVPEAASASFIAGLVALAPAVLFSAAIPGQGGDRHVNEQWQDHWEAEFDRHGYLAIDCIRPKIWEASDVSPWYKQNILLFAERSFIEAHPAMKLERERPHRWPLDIVHPRIMHAAVTQPWKQFRELREERDGGRLAQQDFELAIEAMLKRIADAADHAWTASRRQS